MLWPALRVHCTPNGNVLWWQQVSAFLSHHPVLYVCHHCPAAAARNPEEGHEEHEEDEWREWLKERARKFCKAAEIMC
jgi:hypothetical protein